MKPPSYGDLILKWSHKWSADKNATFQGGVIRRRMMAAHRLTLDDNFTRHIVDATLMLPPGELMKILPASRLPFEHVWMEFSYTALISQAAKYGALHGRSEAAEVGGFLVSRLNESGTLWRADIFTGSSGESEEDARPVILSFVISTEDFVPKGDGRLYQPLSHSWFGGNDTMKLHDDDEGSYLIETVSAMHMLGYTDLVEKGHDVQDHIQVIMSPMYTEGFVDHLLDASRPREKFDEVRRMVMGDLVAMVGVARFLILGLAFINEAYTTKLYFPAKGKAYHKGKFIPYMDRHIVSLNVPNNKTVKQYLTSISREAAKRRAHQVRGHWRQNHETGLERCYHAWAPVDEKHHECERCKRQRVWIKDHQRGDASIGYVQQQYQIHYKKA
jgi:hypothetical protein